MARDTNRSAAHALSPLAGLSGSIPDRELRAVAVNAVAAPAKPRPYLSLRTLCEHLDISESTAHRLRNQSWFPRPLVLAPQVLRWSVAEVDEAMRRYAPRLEIGANPEPAGLASARLEVRDTKRRPA